MVTQDYTCSIEAGVPAKEAYDKIARVPEWWAKNFEGSARKAGDRFTVRWGETFVTFEISEAVPDSRVVWEVVDCYLPWLKDKTEWTGTRVAWEILSSGGKTTVTMIHHGLTPEVECYGSCEKGWNQYFQGSLLRFLTEGTGAPS